MQLNNFTYSWGHIETTGTMVIEPQLDYTLSFRNGIKQAGMKTMKSKVLKTYPKTDSRFSLRLSDRF